MFFNVFTASYCVRAKIIRCSFIYMKSTDLRLEIRCAHFFQQVALLLCHIALLGEWTQWGGLCCSVFHLKINFQTQKRPTSTVWDAFRKGGVESSFEQNFFSTFHIWPKYEWWGTYYLAVSLLLWLMCFWFANQTKKGQRKPCLVLMDRLIRSAARNCKFFNVFLFALYRGSFILICSWRQVVMKWCKCKCCRDAQECLQTR